MTINERRLAEIRAKHETRRHLAAATLVADDVDDLLAMLDTMREELRAIIAAAYPAQPDATPTAREVCEHIGALHDAAARVDAHAAGERCVVCGHTLEDHDRDGWTCDCVRCPWSGESWKARALAAEKRVEDAEKRAEANDAERRLTTFLEEKFVHVTALDEMRERAEDAERKLAALCARGLRVVQLASDDDPEVWPAADSLGAFLADVAPVAERHDRAVRVKELRRMADKGRNRRERRANAARMRGER